MSSNPLDSISADLHTLGLHWVEGVGFRPIDGWEHVAPKEVCKPHGPAWKDTATDAVEREYQCPDVTKWTGHYETPFTPIDAPAWTPPIVTVPGYTTSPAYGVPVLIGGGCGSCWLEAPEPTPEVPPVPLPASGFLLLAAMILIWRMKWTLKN